MAASARVMQAVEASAVISLSRAMRLGGPSGAPGTARRRPLQAASFAGDVPRRVLVVEPDAHARALLATGLRRAGFEVILAASSGGAARELAPDRNLPDLIIAEAELPGMDGFAFCSQLRADQRTAHIPVLLLARKPEDYHPEMMGGVGADDYLPKPVFVQDVIALAGLKAGRPALELRFESSTRELPLADLLRALLSGVRSGRLELAGEAGRITFRKGCVVDATYGGERGERALRRLLMFADGDYTLQYGPPLGEGTLSLDLQGFCQLLLPALRRFRVLRESSVPLEARLVLDFQRLAAELPQLPGGIEDVVRLFDGFRTVRMALLEGRYPETLALEAVTRLYQLGVLSPELGKRSPEVEPKSAPVLFEGMSRSPRSSRSRAAAARAAIQADGLEPELLRQMEAFQIQPVVEPPEPVAIGRMMLVTSRGPAARPVGEAARSAPGPNLRSAPVPEPHSRAAAQHPQGRAPALWMAALLVLGSAAVGLYFLRAAKAERVAQPPASAADVR